jgi:uroporphyrinogen III methyltransferase/synthase
MNPLKLKIGSRRSPLALVQVREILDLLGSKRIRIKETIVPFKTAGDRDKTTPLTVNPADDFFTDSIDRALIKGTVDVAVHSAKDLPKALHPKLEIYALSKALDETDAWVGPLRFAELPKGAKVGTSSLLRQESIKALRPDVKLVSIRGTIQERLNLIWDGKLDGIIVATCALKRLGLTALIKDVLPWEGTPLQGQLAVVGRRDDHELRKLFESIDVRRSYGDVTLVGAGPGDRELITVKGIKALGRADCVFYDYLVDPALLSYASDAEHIYVGKRKGRHALAQAELSRQLRLMAMEGRKVVRLKGGDPLIFGRGADEISYLRSYHIKISVVPGITSATGIPSSLGLPLTARGLASSVSFVSGHLEKDSRDPVSEMADPKTQTTVFYMALTKTEQTVRSLLRKRWKPDTPALVVSKGTRKDQTILKGTLRNIAALVKKHKPEPPALMIVGKTVDFYTPPQDERTILFLGTHPEKYRSLGKIIHFPTIKIIPVRFSKTAREYFLNQLQASDLILVTSEYAVAALFNLFKIYDLKEKAFAAIGSHTAQALLDHDLHPRLIASDETSEGLFKELKSKFHLDGASIVFPRSALPNPFLKRALTKAGVRVKEVAVYKNIKPARRPLPKERIDAAVFTSPSTVVNFLKDYGKIPPSWEILCKGPVSQKTLKKFGYRAEIITN